MAEYIAREVLLAQLRAMESYNASPMYRRGYDDCVEAILKAPAADVVRVVHGRWEYNPPTINTYGKLRCSICNWWTLDPSVDRLYSYCPNCGAKMDGAE